MPVAASSPMTKLRGAADCALPLAAMAIGALACGSDAAFPGGMDGSPDQIDDGSSAPIPDGGVRTDDDASAPIGIDATTPIGDAASEQVGHDASADAGAPFPPCAASPEIYGNLKPAWSMALGGGLMGGVATDSAGNIYVGGSTSEALQIGSTVIAAPDAGGINGPFLVKLDPSGSLVWNRTFAGQGNLETIALDGAGDIYLAGSFNGSGQNPPSLDLGNGVLQGTLFLGKLNSSGATLWSEAFQPFRSGNSSISSHLSLAVDPAGNVAVMGLGLQPAVFGGPALDAGSDGGFVASFDPAGHYRYSKV